MSSRNGTPMSHLDFKMDFHMHSTYSPDARDSMKAMVDACVAKGLTHIAFTDHVDFDAEGGGAWDFNRSAYEKELRGLANAYADVIAIHQGVEIGVQPHLKRRNQAVVDANLYDFVIASLHMVEGCDLYYPAYFQRYDAPECIRRYYREFLTCLRGYDGYAVAGHLDLYLRYQPELMAVPFEAYRPEVDALLTHLIESGKGIELNTGGMRRPLGLMNPHVPILERYRALGGRIVTVSSDAHRTDHVGYGYSEALSALKAIGFDEVCTFERMEPIFHRI